MRNALLVGLGGALGAMARYGVVRLLATPGVAPRVPGATLVVNVVGCLAIGVLAGLAGSRAWLGEPARLFLFTGVLGGFTTYSAFALETQALVSQRAAGPALANVALHLVLGLGAVWVGLRLAGRLG